MRTAAQRLAALSQKVDLKAIDTWNRANRTARIRYYYDAAHAGKLLVAGCLCGSCVERRKYMADYMRRRAA